MASLRNAQTAFEQYKTQVEFTEEVFHHSLSTASKNYENDYVRIAVVGGVGVGKTLLLSRLSFSLDDMISLSRSYKAQNHVFGLTAHEVNLNGSYTIPGFVTPVSEASILIYVFNSTERLSQVYTVLFFH